MEKISSVLPSSKRVAAVDMTEAPPVRPGTPTFGRAEGTSSIRDRVTRSSLTKSNDLMGLQTYKSPKELARTKIAEDIAGKFFGRNTVNVAKAPSTGEGPNWAEELEAYGYEVPQRVEEPTLDVEV